MDLSPVLKELHDAGVVGWPLGGIAIVAILAYRLPTILNVILMHVRENRRIMTKFELERTRRLDQIEQKLQKRAHQSSLSLGRSKDQKGKGRDK